MIPMDENVKFNLALVCIVAGLFLLVRVMFY